jgi:hypothetical protein
MAPAIVPFAVGGPLAGRVARCSDLGSGTMFASLHAEVDFRRQGADLFPLTGVLQKFFPLAGTFYRCGRGGRSQCLN